MDPIFRHELWHPLAGEAMLGDAYPEIIVLPAMPHVIDPADDRPGFFGDQRHRIYEVSRYETLGLVWHVRELNVSGAELLDSPIDIRSSALLDSGEQLFAASGKQTIVGIEQHYIGRVC